MVFTPSILGIAKSTNIKITVTLWHHGPVRFDLAAMTEALYSDPRVRQRICQDYGLEPFGDGGAEDFVGQVIAALGQPQSSEPRAEGHDARSVFKAAVDAIGSNSRTWVSYMNRRDSIFDAISGGDPSAAANQNPAGLVSATTKALSGQHAARDARAIASWAALLAHHPDWFIGLVAIARVFDDLANKNQIAPLQLPEMTACLAGYLAEPRATWPGRHCPGAASIRLDTAERKLPGMGFALGSEFLRNLGWPGFKPDRHIKRLLNSWAPTTVTEQTRRGGEIAALIGRNDHELRTNLSYALDGVALTPGTNYSGADNLVWLLGAYLERKGHETSAIYVLSS